MNPSGTSPRAATVVERIDVTNAGAFTPLAVALGKGRLSRPLNGLIGAGARVDGRPAGLFLAEPRPDVPALAGILTLRVADGLHRRGIGTQLLAAGEEAALAAGIAAMTGLLADGSPEGPAAEALAARAGWIRLRHVRSFFKIAFDAVGHAPWVNRVQPWPAGFDVVPWRTFSPDERAQLLARQGDPRYFDPFLNPFEREREHTLNSVGLRVRGEIAGWAISRHLYPHDPGRGVMSWTRLFVRRDLQRRGHGGMLLAEHIKAGRAAGIEYAVFSVQPDNRLMLRLLEKRVKPIASGVREIWEVGKALAPEGTALLT